MVNTLLPLYFLGPKAGPKSYQKRRLGMITDINLNYVQVATRRGTSLLIPNEVFITQNIENLSYDDTHLRLDILFSAMSRI